jgi:hypothetical protein
MWRQKLSCIEFLKLKKRLIVRERLNGKWITTEMETEHSLKTIHTFRVKGAKPWENMIEKDTRVEKKGLQLVMDSRARV